MTDNARIVREALAHDSLCDVSMRLGECNCRVKHGLSALTALETELATTKADLERAREEAASMLIAWDNATEAMGRFIKNNTKETAEAYMEALGPVAEAHSRARAALAPEQKGE